MCSMKTIEITYKDSRKKERPLIIEGKLNEYDMLVAKIINDTQDIYRACYDPKTGASSCYKVDTKTGFMEECKGHKFHHHCYHTDALKEHYCDFIEIIVIVPVEEEKIIEPVYTIAMAIEEAIEALDSNIGCKKETPYIKMHQGPDYCELCSRMCRGRFCNRC